MSPQTKDQPGQQRKMLSDQTDKQTKTKQKGKAAVSFWDSLVDQARGLGFKTQDLEKKQSQRDNRNRPGLLLQGLYGG